MIRTFGMSPENQEVLAVTLESERLTATVLTWGATLQDCRLEGHEHPLVLGFPTLESYLQDSACHGAIAGRVINRISDAKVAVTGSIYDLDPNFLNTHTLHGGSRGYDSQNWQLVDYGQDFVQLCLDDPDGHMGFPGQVSVQCRYSLNGDGELAIDIQADSHAPTVFNPAHHSYFCLDNSGDIRRHELRILADHYLPSRQGDFPTGEVAPVSGTAFDFREMRQIGTDYDHNFCLAKERLPARHVATLRSGLSGVSMDVITTEPGLQLYTGHQLAPTSTGLTGGIDGARSGLCLEPQMWPDAPTHSHFPKIDLMPGDTYHQHSAFRFRQSAQPSDMDARY